MKRILLISLLLMGCSGGGGGSSTSPITDPEVDEQSLLNTVRCFKTLGNLDFDFVINKFTNGDKFITCTITNASMQVQNSVYYKSTFNGSANETCILVHDVDSTASYGYWTFNLTSGVRKAVYSDTGSPSTGTTVTYASSDCVTATK